jgi:hypothetical protein
MSTKSRARKADQRAARRMGKRMQESYERRAGSTPTIFYEDEYANALKYNGGEQIKKEMGL